MKTSGSFRILFRFSKWTFILTIAVFLGSCEPDCIVDCIHGYANEHCNCNCAGNWSGSLCNDCYINCHEGIRNELLCECECPPEWCGSNCSVEVWPCQNGGQWNSSYCDCDCPDGYGGPDCSDFAGFDWEDDYIFFNMTHVVDGEETFIGQVVQLNNIDGFSVQNTLPAQLWGGETNAEGSLNFNIYFAVLDLMMLEENTTFTIGVDDDFMAQIFDFQAPFEFQGTAVSGHYDVLLVDPLFRGFFDFVLVDGLTHQDTLLITDGIAHYHWP